MVGGATFERDETSEQTSGPGERVRDSEVAKQRQTTREDGWEVNERCQLISAVNGGRRSRTLRFGAGPREDRNGVNGPRSVK